MIAVKREVACNSVSTCLCKVFRGANVSESDDKSLYESSVKYRNDTPILYTILRNAWECVQSPLVVLTTKVRIGGDFFYGKSENQNHIESL